MKQIYQESPTIRCQSRSDLAVLCLIPVLVSQSSSLWVNGLSTIYSLHLSPLIQQSATERWDDGLVSTVNTDRASRPGTCPVYYCYEDVSLVSADTASPPLQSPHVYPTYHPANLVLVSTRQSDVSVSRIFLEHSAHQLIGISRGYHNKLAHRFRSTC